MVTVSASTSTAVTTACLTFTDGRRAHNAPDRAGYVALGELRGGQLIEEGLELVVIVLVDQGDLHTPFSQILRAGHAGKATPDDHGRSARILLFRHALDHLLGYSPGLLCMIPPSAKTVVAVM